MTNIVNYNVHAFNSFGSRILTEGTRTMRAADKLARDFLAYNNVYTVDVTNDHNTLCYRLVKIDGHKGIQVWTDGRHKNIRF